MRFTTGPRCAAYRMPRSSANCTFGRDRLSGWRTLPWLTLRKAEYSIRRPCDFDPHEAMVGGLDKIRPQFIGFRPEDAAVANRKRPGREDVINPQIARSIELGRVLRRISLMLLVPFGIAACRRYGPKAHRRRFRADQRMVQQLCGRLAGAVTVEGVSVHISSNHKRSVSRQSSRATQIVP